MHKRRYLILVGLGIVLLLVSCAVLGPYFLGVQHFKADPE